MVYFSMEEWDFLEEQKDLYEEIMMENQQLLGYVNLGKNHLLLSEMILNLSLSQPPVTSPDGSRKRNPPQRCPRPLDSRDCAHEDHNYAHRFQGKDLIDLKVEVNVDQTLGKGDQSMEEVEIMVVPQEEESLPITMEDKAPLTSPEGSRKRNPLEGCPCPRDSTQEDHNYLPIPHHDPGDRNKGHNDLYEDLMTEPTHSGNPTDRCPCPRDSTQEDHNYLPIPHHDTVGGNERHNDLYEDNTMEPTHSGNPTDSCSCPRDSTQEDHNYLPILHHDTVGGNERHNDLYEDVTTEPPHNRSPPEGCLQPPYSRDTTQEDHSYLPTRPHDEVDGNGRHNDFYKDVVLEPTHNRSPPEGCPCPRDSTQEDHNYAQHYQCENLMSMEADHRTEGEEEVNVGGDDPSMEEAGMARMEIEEESSPDIPNDGTSHGNSPEGCPRPRDSTLEDHNYAQHYQCEDLTNVKTDRKPEEEINVRDDHRSIMELAGMMRMMTKENKEEPSLEMTKDGSSNGSTPKTCPRPPDPWDCAPYDLTIPHHDQDEELNFEVKNEEEETVVMRDQHFSEVVELMDTDKEEESPLDISSDGHHVWNSSEGPIILSPDYKAEDDDVAQHSPGVNLITRNRPHTPSLSETSMAPSDTKEPCNKSCTKTPCRVMDRSHDPSDRSASPLSCKADVTGGHLWSCLVCGKGFAKHRTLLRHQRVHTGEHPFSCTESGKHFAVKEALLRHQRIHSGACPFTCAECGKCFSMKAELLRHQRIHTSEEHFSCSDFRRCFTQKGKLDINLKRPREHDPFSCLECGKCFIQEEDLLKHHTGEHPFSCSECEKCFIEKRTLLIHHRSHTGEHAHSCLECGKSFTGNRTQRSRNAELPISCSDCRKCLIQEDDLDRHQKLHTGERPFSCLKCGKCFSMKQSLLIHKTIHTGERTFPCSECGKCFAAKGKLLIHQRIHRGERPFSCSECGKCFSLKRRLLIHQRVHAGAHPGLCSTCGKCFTEKESQRCHAHEGSFSCSLCGKSFNHKENLIRHQSTHSC